MTTTGNHGHPVFTRMICDNPRLRIETPYEYFISAIQSLQKHPGSQRVTRPIADLQDEVARDPVRDRKRPKDST